MSDIPILNIATHLDQDTHKRINNNLDPICSIHLTRT